MPSPAALLRLTTASGRRPNAVALAVLAIATLLDMAILAGALGGGDALATPVRAPATCGCSIPLS
ncbi:hypothetical protein [Novosphingobium colocasiae]|uniref:Uncharacterized protein n=1 Tax=Novosphingobium colocasiae TaxID=1256513 RepID=A0A918PMV1_9SPHN|nr:hypothetical protein [Novosphingobium colocasiae]GGZ16268.1 hypothetical protein GCM10011614_33810 [Novosphingobium colocasiae]